MAQLREHASKTASLSTATEEDRTLLVEAEERLATTVERLVHDSATHDKLVIWLVDTAKLDPPPPVLAGIRIRGLVDLWSALADAAYIGANCSDGPILGRHAGKKRAAKRLATQKAKKDQISSDILTLAAEARKANRKLKDEGIAGEILADFCKLHSKNPPWTKDGVASRIRKLVRAGQLAAYSPPTPTGPAPGA